MTSNSARLVQYRARKQAACSSVSRLLTRAVLAPLCCCFADLSCPRSPSTQLARPEPPAPQPRGPPRCWRRKQRRRGRRRQKSSLPSSEARRSSPFPDRAKLCLGRRSSNNFLPGQVAQAERRRVQQSRGRQTAASSAPTDLPIPRPSVTGKKKAE